MAHLVEAEKADADAEGDAAGGKAAKAKADGDEKKRAAAVASSSEEEASVDRAGESILEPISAATSVGGDDKVRRPMLLTGGVL